MANPYLPNWEYIPDGEPRVFGSRIYIYGSHDHPASDTFCDFKLKVWSAPIEDPGNWTCHGDAFHTRPDRDHSSDTPWTQNELYAPDVVEKDGKYYLYAYIQNAKGCVAVSEYPEGPFELLSPYSYTMPESVCVDGQFIDPGVLVDDDGRVYIYCGFQRSFMAEINPDNMYEIIPGSHIEDILPTAPQEEPHGFFEACSPRKIGSTYYLIYSPNNGGRLAYATSDKPTGPFTYRGYMIENGIDYPGGNNHGSICEINGQWYLFYHRTTNGTTMSRRGCVEKIERLPDGSIPLVEMTSLGFEDALNPYEIQPAEIACVLKGGCIITEQNLFSRIITNITNDCIIGYKYFDFGNDYSSKTMLFQAEVIGRGCHSNIHIMIDEPCQSNEIGICPVGTDSGIISAAVQNVTGKHAVFFVIQENVSGYFVDMFKNRHLFDLKQFVFIK